LEQHHFWWTGRIWSREGNKSSLV